MRRLFRALGSLKTGIVLLVAITVCALVGVVVPQGLEAQRYLHKWGPVAGSMLLSIGLDHLFSTLWYTVLLGLFSLNVFICTVNRIRVSITALLRPGFLTAEQIARFPLRVSAGGRGTLETVEKGVSAFFKRRHYGVALSRADDTVLIDARRGALREIGMALLHLSLLPLLIGGLIGKTTGYSYQQVVGAGERAAVRERSFFVRCDYFKLERNENGDVKDYKSKLTLLDSAGTELTSKVIEVNHPLVYHGVKFYQSSYRADPLQVDTVQLIVRGSAVGPLGKRVAVRMGIPATVEGTGLSVAVHRFIPDFWIDMETREPKTRSMQHNNPAFLVSVTDAADTLFYGWVFQKYGAMHHTDDTCSVALMTYGQQYATGLLIKENPGGPAIWAGIIFMSIGVLLVFWVPCRRIRIALRREGDNVLLTAGSTRLRSDPEADKHFNEAVAALAAELQFTVKEQTANAIN